MIWGRRSRGRKLPGLVKYAQVIGDLEQIEEWNEYGELKEQIDDNPAVEALPTKTAAPAAPAQVSGPPSRDSSETRHISISEPPKSADRNPAATLDQTGSPMAMVMRQAGAEAAAKAGQKKTLKPMPTAPKPTEKETTAPIVEARIASPMADPSTEPEMTQAKAPAQLAAEGAKRTSVDKIATTEMAPDASGIVGASSETSASNEQQVADMRRTSSIAKAPSKLSETQTHDAVPEEAAEVKYEPKYEARPRTHRGSSLSQASREEIREMERRNSIAEDPDEDAEDVVEDAPAAKSIAATDDGGKPSSEEILPEKAEAKDAESAGVSVGD